MAHLNTKPIVVIINQLLGSAVLLRFVSDPMSQRLGFLIKYFLHELKVDCHQIAIHNRPVLTPSLLLANSVVEQ